MPLQFSCIGGVFAAAVAVDGAGGYAFAGAGFALEQDGGIGGRGLDELLDERLYERTAAEYWASLDCWVAPSHGSLPSVEFGGKV